MKFNTVSVIGLGLIGGSVCRAIKKFGTSSEVVGIESDSEVLEFAIKEGVVDKGSSDLSMVSGSDVVVVATYVDMIYETIEKLVPYLNNGCLVTDVGSVKSEIVGKISNLLTGEISYIGSHPIAGKEHSGIKNSDADLFTGNKVIITPTEISEETAIKKLTSFWSSLGGNVVSLDPYTHDKIFAYVSHLPHVVAYSLINTVASADAADDIFSFSGGGLQDYTRIAASSPEMWKSIFLQNRDSILESIKTFKLNLEKAESAIKNEDLNELQVILEGAQKLKLSRKFK